MLNVVVNGSKQFKLLNMFVHYRKMTNGVYPLSNKKRECYTSSIRSDLNAPKCRHFQIFTFFNIKKRSKKKTILKDMSKWKLKASPNNALCFYLLIIKLNQANESSKVSNTALPEKNH